MAIKRTFLAGETIRVTAADLTHSDNGSVTSGATGTISLHDADGNVEDTATPDNGGSGDDWFVDLTAPATAGEYTIKASLTSDSAVWRAIESITVRGF